jgi:diguanylate cyclase (GGDEF)-like protein/PAS domain S-box-containing protein
MTGHNVAWRDDSLAQVVETVGHAVIATDLDGVVFLWNRAAEELYGWSAGEAVGRVIYDLTVPDHGHKSAIEIMAELADGRPWSGAFTVRRKDSSTFSAWVTSTVLRDDAGRPAGMVGVSINLGEALRPFLLRSHEAAVVTDADGVVRLGTPAITALTGWREDELADREWWDYVHPDDRELVRAVHAAAALTRELLPPLEHRVHCADGSWTWVDTSVTNLMAEPMVRGIVLVLRDVSERRTWMEQLTQRALHDTLTGLANRTSFNDHLRTHLVSRNHGGTLLYIDINDFKAINDSLGHAAGDVVLRAVADRLTSSVRPEDICARLGGDEFAVLANNATGTEQAVALTRRIAAAIAQPLAVDGTTVYPTASIGTALLTGIDDPDRALGAADADMYRRKRQLPTRGNGRSSST